MVYKRKKQLFTAAICDKRLRSRVIVVVGLLLLIFLLVCSHIALDSVFSHSNKLSAARISALTEQNKSLSEKISALTAQKQYGGISYNEMLSFKQFSRHIRQLASRARVEIELVDMSADTGEPLTLTQRVRNKSGSKEGAKLADYLLPLATNGSSEPVTVSSVVITFTGSYPRTISFLEALERHAPQLFVTHLMVESDKRISKISVEGIILVSAKKPGQSRQVQVNMKLPSLMPQSLDPTQKPVVAEMYEKGVSSSYADSYQKYLRRELSGTDAGSGSAAGESQPALLTLILRRHGQKIAVIGGRKFRVGDRIGVLEITNITPHAVIFRDPEGVFILNMSGLNHYRSRLEY